MLTGLLPGQPVGVTYNGTQGVGAFSPHPASADNSSANEAIADRLGIRPG